MRLTFWLILLMLGLVAAPATDLWAREGQFFNTRPDLPIPPGMQENLDLSVDYEVGPARISEVVANGRMSVNTITQFYADTLPMLGWQMTRTQIYIREQEQLEIVMTPKGDQIEVKLTLTPIAKKP